MTRRGLLSPLALRVTAAFVVVAAAAIAVLVALLLAATRTQVADLVTSQHAADAAAAAAAAAEAYAAAGGWEGADLTGAAAVAARGQASLIVTDAAGVVVAAATAQAAEMMADMHGVEVVDVPRGEPVAATVTVDGEPVGAVHLAYPAAGLPAAERQVRDSLSRVVVLGALLSVIVAVAVATFVARRVTQPVLALTDAATALEQGDRDVRVTGADAPGELGQLAAAFDSMAAAVAREDQLRRQVVEDVAHELRTPLTILRATTEGLVDQVLPADAATLSSLHDEVLRLSALVADLETLAAADAAGLMLARDPIDLDDVVTAVVSLARPAAGEAGVSLQTDLAGGRVLGDERRLNQVVTNLVANAIAYTPSGGDVTVRTRADDHEAVLEVIDTGPGLPGDEPERVFDRFYRGSAGRQTGGSGIGLAVAKQLVAAHGGSVMATNTEHGGARFSVRLPRV